MCLIISHFTGISLRQLLVFFKITGLIYKLWYLCKGTICLFIVNFHLVLGIVLWFNYISFQVGHTFYFIKQQSWGANDFSSIRNWVGIGEGHRFTLLWFLSRWLIWLLIYWDLSCVQYSSSLHVTLRFNHLHYGELSLPFQPSALASQAAQRSSAVSWAKTGWWREQLVPWRIPLGSDISLRLLRQY